MLSMIFLLTASLCAAPDAQINMLIDEVVNASPETRYEKMNAFKLKMRELNAQQRNEALRALRSRAYPELDPATAPQAEGQQAGKNGAALQQLRQQRMQQQPGGSMKGRPQQPQQQHMPR